VKILIFGGTTEGRLLAEALCNRGHKVTVSVATALGAEELTNISCTVLTGRLDEQAMLSLLPEYDLIVDATHPYAAIVSQNLRKACAACGAPLKRVARPAGSFDEESVIAVYSCAQAAEVLSTLEGSVLLTTGAKELAAFAGLDPNRVYARVLPTHEGISACEALGLPHRNILALQGPFSETMNTAMLEQYHIRWMVTKNSGSRGGFEEKLRAAQRCGAGIVLVCPPEDEGITMEAFLDEVDA